MLRCLASLRQVLVHAQAPPRVPPGAVQRLLAPGLQLKVSLLSKPAGCKPQARHSNFSCFATCQCTLRETLLHGLLSLRQDRRASGGRK